MRCFICSLGLAALALAIDAGAAFAGANYAFTVAGKKGALTCTKDTASTPPATDTMAIQITMTGALKLQNVTVKVGAQNLPLTLAQDGKGTGGVATVPLKGVQGDSFTTTVITDQGEKACDEVKLARVAAQTTNEPQTGDRDELSDADAYRWWVSADGIGARDAFQRTGEERGLPEDAALLVHLPSGRLVFPSGTSLREGTPVQVVVIASRASGFEFAPKECASLKTFRTVGDGAAPPPAEKQAADGALGATPRPMLVGVGPYVRCGAGSLSYDLSYGTGTTAKTLSTTKLEMRPVYSFALVTAIGFDTTISRDFEAIPGEAGNVIAAKHDRFGPTILIGGQWMLGGVDYTDMRWYNYFANPFVAFDAASPLSGFVAGNTFTLTGGISLAVGLAAHRGVRLKGAQLGDSLGELGDVPRDNTWRRQRLGFYIGVALDSKVFEALKSR